MDREAFCELFGCDELELEGYIQQGMPWSGEEDNPVFNEADVATWLLVNGHAVLNPERVARTQAEAASRLGVTENTVRKWLRIEDFPGRQGYYPIQEIRSWDAFRDKQVNQYATASQSDQSEEKPKQQELSIKEQRDLLKLRQERGELIEAEEVKRMLTRLGSYLVSELNSLTGRVESRLPAGIEDELVAIIREAHAQAIDELRDLIAEFELWEHASNDNVEPGSE